MHVVVLQHLTPDLIRRPEFLSHANTCTGVIEMSGRIVDADGVASKLALLLGGRNVTNDSDSVHCELPTGHISICFCRTKSTHAMGTS